MKVLAVGDDDKVIVELSTGELELLTGQPVRRDSHYSSTGKRRAEFVGSSYELKNWKETVVMAEAVRYKSKQAIEAIDQIRGQLNEALFPFIDTFKIKEKKGE
jgi:hypothetical protein